MSYVSSKPLPAKVLKRIGDLLVEEIAKAKTHTQAHILTEALFTETERIMLAKRFAIVMLLDEGASYRYIQSALKVSLSTVFRIQKLRKAGVFDNLIKHTYKRPSRPTRREHNQETAFEVLVRAGLPPMGRGRWKFLYKKTDRVTKGESVK